MEFPQTYGILANNEYKFQGNIIVVLYEKKFGLYPYYKNFSDPTSAVNGGIPQRANLTAHLAKLRDDIEKAIPNEGFNGLAVIDYEKWRPLWEHNWYTKRIYRRESIAYVMERYPNKNKTDAKLTAMNEFNQASLEFLIKTIREAKKIRPFALWGYYGMPFCNYSAGRNGTIACGEVFERFNDRLLPLYNESTALYPSIYLPKREMNLIGCLYVISVLKEAKRIADELQLPIYAFTGIEYFPLINDPYYTQQDLRNSLRRASAMGVDGVIIWSTSKNMAKRCVAIGNYIRYQLGPEVLQLKEFTKICSETNRYPENCKFFREMKNGLKNYHCYQEDLDIILI
ncbi:Hyaluronidase family protein [Acanthocheilonema viteae]|uniref:Hyaluronidase n=1 Tax=Acanthocheilonema viteae TaxID=6277 RepID=A0A498SCG6_ACAVI|nr:unnamed protein product [Acanthocheilonema viteae]